MKRGNVQNSLLHGILICTILVRLAEVVTGWGKFWKQHLLVSDWHIENPSENLANISSSLPILNLSRLDLDKEKKLQIINKLINYSGLCSKSCVHCKHSDQSNNDRDEKQPNEESVEYIRS